MMSHISIMTNHCKSMVQRLCRNRTVNYTIAKGYTRLYHASLYVNEHKNEYQTGVQLKKGMLTEDQAVKALQNDAQLRHSYDSLKTSTDDEDRLEARRKRVIYRSKQRGWLEVDLLLGAWATEHVPHLNENQLDQYERLMSQETIDIYNYITGKDIPPQHLQNEILEMLQQYTRAAPASSPEAYEAIKRYMSN